MKTLTFKELNTNLANHSGSFDMNDFIDAYVSNDIKIYINHSGFIVKRSLDDNTGKLNGFDPDTIKPFRGMVEPLDDLNNQDIVSLLQNHSGTIIHANIKGEPYTLLTQKPMNEEFLDINNWAKFYTSSDFLVDKIQFEQLINTLTPDQPKSEKSLLAENQKLLRIIGAILAGINHSDRYKSLTQNVLYDLMAQTVDTQKLKLGDSTVETVFSRANDLIENYIIKK
ncbi:hypothetical protein [Acinetobacter bereziniae]|uniref:hypothetical protein n=1 Tax=Acinetobacter bereziniae TaxID=106648 RepID=UPI000C2C8C12|nr:hypothetical protein [Acinetobacter bereziniae]ATZ65450.1 hypothetical protein BSR55_20040 [Acinetobacter bereziniae]